MKLSVIVVNYNVEHFLEQCLFSVRKACEGISAEVIVVDNYSVDGSVKMLKEKFPEVKLILNKDNRGFSKANNQAIKVAQGEYVLLLNPDTVVEDDTFSKSVEFMDHHPEAGGLGVKLVDGSGVFHPESKRGVPTPAVAFYKIFGFAKLFPRSRTFGRYHMGYLDKDEVNEVDVLVGAYMMLRKSVLDEVGLLDEEYFMYGEDIDLSYRIIKAGYKNYYFPKARTIHYKGESTKKHSVNYVYVFYKAMKIFAGKHFSQKNARMFSMLINFAIYLRAFFAVLSRFLSNALLPILDTVMIFIGIYGITEYWGSNVIFTEGGHYPLGFIIIAVPLYVLIWLFSVFINGGYDKPVKLSKILQGLVVGTIIILVIYALLSEEYRFSRALIIFGAVWGFVAMFGIRFMLHLLKIKRYKLGVNENRRFVIIGEKEETGRVTDLIRKTYINPGFIGLISANDKSINEHGYIGHLNQIDDITDIYKIDEVIFCAKDIPAQKIIDIMSELQNPGIDYRIARPESTSLIGSNSVSTSGDLYIIEINSISKTKNRRNKRLFDFIMSVCLLVVFPVLMFFIKNPHLFLRNIILVLFGIRSWVGYKITSSSEIHNLPAIKRGVLFPVDAFKNKTISDEANHKLNLLYARDYRVLNDLSIIVKGLVNLGRK